MPNQIFNEIHQARWLLICDRYGAGPVLEPTQLGSRIPARTVLAFAVTGSFARAELYVAVKDIDTLPWWTIDDLAKQCTDLVYIGNTTYPLGQDSLYPEKELSILLSSISKQIDITNLYVGCKLRTLRQQANLLLEDVAVHLDITASYLSLVETGRKVPSNEVVVKAAKLYNVTEIDIATPSDSVVDQILNLARSPDGAVIAEITSRLLKQTK